MFKFKYNPVTASPKAQVPLSSKPSIRRHMLTIQTGINMQTYKTDLFLNQHYLIIGVFLYIN